jgi:hypothetical protein
MHQSHQLYVPLFQRNDLPKCKTAIVVNGLSIGHLRLFDFALLGNRMIVKEIFIMLLTVHAVIIAI